jgi:hypothetical protein
MLNSPIAIFWPLAFAILQTLMSSLADSDVRDGERKFRVWLIEGGKYTKITPLAVQELQSKIFGKEQSVSDVEELPLSFIETSFGIDLCFVALSTDFVNLLILPGLPQNALILSLHQYAVLALFVEFISVAGIATFLRHGRVHEKNLRILFTQITNFVGLGTMFFSFLILGSSILHGQITP